MSILETQNHREMEIVQKKRVEYIDCMRGFAILWVVFGHVLFFVGGNTLSPWSKLLNSFQIPLFFFISGLVSYSTKSIGIKDILTKVYDKTKNLLIPTIISGGLYVICFGHDIWNAVTDNMKDGYWFTFVLFEIFVAYYLLCAVIQRFQITRRGECIILLSIIVLSYAILSLCVRLGVNFNAPWLGTLCIRQFMLYLKFFLMGILAQMYMPLFLQWIKNKFIITITGIVFATIFLSGTVNNILSTIASVMAVFAIYGLFYTYHETFSLATRTGKTMTYIGRHTLQIYFLHYFVLEGFKGLSSYDFMPIITSHYMVEFLFGLTLTAILVGMSLLFDKVLRVFPLLYSAMFGPKLAK